MTQKEDGLPNYRFQKFRSQYNGKDSCTENAVEYCLEKERKPGPLELVGP